jgi:hypothetical protein
VNLHAFVPQLSYSGIFNFEGDENSRYPPALGIPVSVQIYRVQDCFILIRIASAKELK